MRRITKTYQDPLELIWVDAARKLGMTIERSPEVFASWNGKGTLFIGTAETLDPDDSVAQMIFHEICHALCESPDGWSKPDWGLESNNPAHRVREYACLRLQAALAAPFGLQSFLAATTVFRGWYDRVADGSLDDSNDPSAEIAHEAQHRLQAGPWLIPVREALRKTAEIARIVQSTAADDSLWSTYSEPLESQHASPSDAIPSSQNPASTGQAAR